MEDKMLTDGIGKVTFSNDVLRVELVKTAPDGNLMNSGVLEIPRGSIENVTNGLVSAITEINDQITSAQNKESDVKDKKEPGNGKKKKN